MIMRALIASLLLLLVATATPAAAEKTYSAERFDAHLRILPDGAMEVVETVVFRFESGPFQHVFRDLPRRRTDDIKIVSAEMDGRALAFGKESGQVEVRNGSKLRVQWRFAPRTDSTNTFVLTYVVRGIVQRQAGRDVLDWVALPTEHDYRIDDSEVSIALPAAPVVRPTAESKRVAEVVLEPAGERVKILARGVGRNGWVRTRLEFEEGAIIAAAPAWQQRQIAARAVAPRWVAAAGIVLGVGLMFLFALRQGYDSPHAVAGSPGTVETLPDTLRPSLAGALAANGAVTLQHAMATLFALADRGVVTIIEEPRKWGQRNFTLQRRQTKLEVAPEDTAVLSLAFQHQGQPQNAVPLAQARKRVIRGLREFRTAVNQELRTLGMLDDERIRVRARYLGFSIAFLSLSALLVAPAIFLTRQFEGWPFLVPGAVAAVAVIGFIVYGALTPLSNEGVRRAERWRAYQKHLKEVAREREQLTLDSPARLLPFAVALGLAAAWSKYVKNHPTGIPPWFRALAVAGDDGGFPAFIAASGAGADGGAGGGGGGGGAAGGGGSGAG
jgi:Predicted membrane protein (DUF2207) C-terminal domain/Predicted membrane protein (DUF2207) N-terminal domain